MKQRQNIDEKFTYNSLYHTLCDGWQALMQKHFFTNSLTVILSNLPARIEITIQNAFVLLSVLSMDVNL